MYAAFGTLQRSVQTVLNGELPAASRAVLEVALETLKTTRLLLVDVDPTAVVEPEIGDPADETEAETAEAEVYEL